MNKKLLSYLVLSFFSTAVWANEKVNSQICANPTSQVTDIGAISNECDAIYQLASHQSNKDIAVTANVEDVRHNIRLEVAPTIELTKDSRADKVYSSSNNQISISNVLPQKALIKANISVPKIFHLYNDENKSSSYFESVVVAITKEGQDKIIYDNKEHDINEQHEIEFSKDKQSFLNIRATLKPQNRLTSNDIKNGILHKGTLTLKLNSIC